MTQRVQIRHNKPATINDFQTLVEQTTRYKIIVDMCLWVQCTDGREARGMKQHIHFENGFPGDVILVS